MTATCSAVSVSTIRGKKFSQMEGLCDSALAQIAGRNYTAGLLDEGYLQIIKYGICFCRKSCMVKT